MASKKISYSELDFDSVKNNLKVFLSGQDTFKDYNFDGSGLSIIVDLLAYNTMYNGVYNNLSINEMFLDSARKRNSVVSKAKELGYVPYSARCARATIDVTLTSPTPTTFTLPANTPFLTTVDGVIYTFYNDSTLVTTTLALNHTFKGVEITEKSNILTYDFPVSTGARFIIPNANVDLTTLTVSIQDSISGSILTPFVSSDTIINITSASKVYWIKEIDDGLYELVFGDGVLGKALTPGNIVKVNYCISSLTKPNGAKLFNCTSSFGAGVSVSILTTSASAGGAGPESIDSIKFNAPRAYSAQNRGVSVEDYKALISANFPSAKSVTAWGGEDNIPAVYGKTFICVKPKATDVLTTAEKDYILNTILANKSVVTITPVIVDPETIDIVLDTTVYYNEMVTNRTADSIKSLVTATVLKYNTDELQQFDGIFRYSKLSKLIDNSEDSIINNITTVSLKVYVTPKYNILASYSINLINPIYYSGAAEDIVISSGFYITGKTDIFYLVDDGIGNMMLFTKATSGARTIIDASIGSVNYTTGTITIDKININALVGDSFTFFIKPSSNDVVSALTKIAQISESDLTVNVISDKTVKGDMRAGKNYTFTTSRT